MLSDATGELNSRVIGVPCHLDQGRGLGVSTVGFSLRRCPCPWDGREEPRRIPERDDKSKRMDELPVTCLVRSSRSLRPLLVCARRNLLNRTTVLSARASSSFNPGIGPSSLFPLVPRRRWSGDQNDDIGRAFTAWSHLSLKCGGVYRPRENQKRF